MRRWLLFVIIPIFALVVLYGALQWNWPRARRHSPLLGRIERVQRNTADAVSRRLGALSFAWQSHTAKPEVPPRPDDFVYDGSVTDLQATEVVFSADSPLAPDKSAIWCSTVVMAWQQAQSHLTTGTLTIPAMPELTQQLNAAPPAKASLPESWYYLGFGELPDDMLLPRLTKELQAKFTDAPDFDLPGYNPTLQGFVSLAYLRGGAVFNPAFKEEPRELSFPGLDGKPSQVSCFGVDEETAGTQPEVRKHVRMLQSDLLGPPPPEGTCPGFVLDLTADNPGLQVIIAKVAPQATLQATWQAVAELARKWRYRNTRDYYEFGLTDTLTVPVIAFQLDKLWLLDLETPSKPEWQVLPYSLYQRVGFSLTASGALVKSTSGLYPNCSPRDFVFDQPFLIAMKLRKAEEPFFLMWVANAELMRKR